LPDIKLSEKIFATSDLNEATKANIWFIVIPCQNLRSFLKILSAYDYKGKTIVICSKGIEYTTLKFPSEILKEELPDSIVGLLSGPNFATEVAKSIHTASVLALSDFKHASQVVRDITGKSFHLYITSDLRGVEIGGATKNIIALCCGMVRGIGLGENTIASLISLGLAEISKFAITLGARAETLYGIAGLGDLILSCTSQNSRNFKFGFELGKGLKLEGLLKEQSTVEGYYSTKALYKLACELNIEMPLIKCINQILYENAPISTAINLLFAQLPEKEFY
jgi:glycerol-3-phosphate dehydrogenase (NAD(P)+)